MNRSERHQEIIKLVQLHTSMSTNQLADQLGVTPMTIRRDLEYLDQNNLLKRSHGFARVSPNELIPSIQDRNFLHHEEKLNIARKALLLIKPNQSIILDSGSTTLILSKLMKQEQIPNLTVITNSLDIARELSGIYQTILCGGIVQQHHMSLIGPDAENFFKTKTADLLFLGATGIRDSIGFTTSSPFQYSIKKQMIRSSQHPVMLMDSSKFGTNSLNIFCEFQEIKTFITAKNSANQRILDEIASLGVRILPAND